MIVVVVMVTVGMELRLEQFRAFLVSPRVLVLGSLVHTLTFPLLVVVMVFTIQALELSVSSTTIIGMLLIAACPSGGFSNVMALMARANLPLSVALTTVSSLLSFVTVPVLMTLFGSFIGALDAPVSLPIGETLMQLIVLVVLPIGAGMWWRALAPGFIERNLARLQKGGQLAFYVVLALVLVENAQTISAGVGEALPWSILLCVTNIAGCYVAAKLVGLEVLDRVTVALEGSIRDSIQHL